MAHARDENLPEVVPDFSPQALSQEEYFKLKGLDGGDGKYPYGPGWDEPTPTSTTTSFETPPPPASSTKSSPSPSPTIAFLNNQTDPESQFAFQAYSHPNYGGQASDILETEGFIDLPFDATSYVWTRNETNCCLTFCQGNATDVGYWCQSRRQPEASSDFDRIYIWCGRDPEKEKNKCSKGE
ncbi:hypothetical protein F5X68DRAFT_227923 [Plectosphaerella plurivora]|uniref:Uncharacterized protein n=1 Tax=Plectosphaerella plurivora TaxID=936078 RepID=A0A9P8VIN7_9PEZI|nr:hypothetical protein F5X68DRAFT_227923 [Plectosphaerella plurivora]